MKIKQEGIKPEYSDISETKADHDFKLPDAPSPDNKKLIYFIFGGTFLFAVVTVLYLFVFNSDDKQLTEDETTSTSNDLKQKELELKVKELMLKEKELNQKTAENNISLVPISGGTQRFRGAYFEIFYPDNFTAVPSLKHPDGGYRSVYFKSPDGLAEFYIFATWHYNENNELLPDLSRESIEQDEIKKQDEFTEVHYYTYAAKDGSYKRSYMDVDKNGMRTIYGFKYKNQEVYNYYKDSYLKFKKSLTEFAD